MGIRLVVALTPWLARSSLPLPWQLRSLAGVVLLETLFIHASRGTSVNHNVLLHQVCLLVMGCMATRIGLGRRVLLGGCVASVLLVGVLQFDTRLLSGTTWNRHDSGAHASARPPHHGHGARRAALPGGELPSPACCRGDAPSCWTPSTWASWPCAIPPSAPICRRARGRAVSAR